MLEANEEHYLKDHESSSMRHGSIQDTNEDDHLKGKHSSIMINE